MVTLRPMLAAAVAALLALPAAAHAQRAVPSSFAPAAAERSLLAPAPAAPSEAARPFATGEATDSTAVRTADAKDALAPRDHADVGPNVGLMIIGGAAIVTGSVIGGSGGTLIAVGGAVVGLYGLYKYLH